MQTNPVIEQNKNIKWSVEGKEERTTEEGFAKEPIMKFRMKEWTSKRRWDVVKNRESEDGKDDELPCVIGESVSDQWGSSYRNTLYWCSVEV